MPWHQRSFINIICILSILVFISNCGLQKLPVAKAPCATKYPIILVHGILYRDDVPVLKYWSGLPKALEKNGARVYLANTNAFGSHIENALQLREKILNVLQETGAEKVNIIAHSKGGLESRYMISRLDMANKVASLTTLATPHWGSYQADSILCWLDKHQILTTAIKLVNGYGRLIGDVNPDALTAANNLTLGYMKDFNQSVPDVPQVYYQSYGGIISRDYPSWIIRFQEKLLRDKEGDSDGTVSFKSYQWGNFKGIVKSDQEFGVSHFDIVGMKFVSKQSTFNAEAFLIDIVQDLKERGL